jgi:hypothetical protein
MASTIIVINHVLLRQVKLSPQTRLIFSLKLKQEKKENGTLILIVIYQIDII